MGGVGLDEGKILEKVVEFLDQLSIILPIFRQRILSGTIWIEICDPVVPFGGRDERRLDLPLQNRIPVDSFEPNKRFDFFQAGF